LIVPALVLGAVLIISNQPIQEDDPQIYFAAGNAYAKAGDYPSAVSNYEMAVKLDPYYEQALSNLAFSYNQLGMYTVAAGVLRQAMAIHPENPSYHYDYAVNLVLSIKQDGEGSIEEVNEALEHFKIAEQILPGYAHVSENVAFLEDLRKQYYGKA
jgi:tetratricopeptide (TPR) repeat protein